MKLTCYRSILFFIALCTAGSAQAQSTPPPARPWAISGSRLVCVGSTTALADTNGGGTGIWSSSDVTIATVTNGTVTGIAAGAATISYTYVDSALVLVTDVAYETVNPMPAVSAISGNTVLCVGSGTTLSDIASGGTWSISNSNIASVDNSGAVSGLAAGNDTITYTLTNSCGTSSASVDLTISIAAAPITQGAAFVCMHSSINLNDDSTGGTWTSGNTAIATINPGNGITTGVSAGIATITYTLPGGCMATANVLVNPLPDAGTISGTMSIARGGGTTLADAASGGIWHSCNSLIASVNGAGGITGIADGSTLISYSVTNSCGTAYAFATIIVGSCTTATNISTFAGSHVNGYSGDGGFATAAQMGNAFQITADGVGNVYIADFTNNVVRKVDPSGIITTIAGTGVAGYNGDNIAATSAQLNGPMSVTLDGLGNIYIADKYNERIRMINTSGIITTIAGTGHHGGWQGYGSGNGGPATAANLDFPVSVALDCAGNIYVSDQGSETVRKIDPSGTINLFAGTYGGGYNGDDIPANTASLNNPSGITADCAGNVYIADAYNNRVRKVDASGMITTIAGNGVGTYAGDGLPGGSASLWIPNSVTLDACGDLYISDWQNNVVRVLSTDGYISTFAGKNANDWHGYDGDGGPADSAYMYLPGSVAIDGLGNIYIADFGNYVIRAIGNLLPAFRKFANGTTQDATVCENQGAVSLDDMMSIPDATAGMTETWTVSVQPLHGTLSGFGATATSRNGITTPTGLTYTPQAGYSGMDAFTVVMNDGVTAASTTVNVKVIPTPNPGVITGATNIADGNNITLADAAGDINGVWSSNNSQIATVDASGNVTGTGNGIATISYTVTNSCGAKSATTGIVIAGQNVQSSKALLFPNPNNGNFQCEFTSANDCQLDLIVTDVTGRIVYKQAVTAVTGTNVVAVDLPADIQRPSLLTVSLENKNIKYPAVKINVTE